MKRRLLICALACAVVACGDEERPIVDFVSEPIDAPARVTWTLHVGEDVDADTFDAITEAAHAWRAAVAGFCPLAITVERAQLAAPDGWPGAGRIDVRVIPAGTGLAGTALVLDGRGGKIVLAPRGADTPGNRWAFGVAARHELGHVFELEHADGGVMQTPAASGITEANAHAFARRWCR